jgi:putative membrane protein
MMKALVLTATLLLAACTPDSEQHAHPRRASGNAPSPILPSQDRDFLEHAVQGSNAEIDIGKLVRTHAWRPEVKAYGERMVADHSALNARLAAIAHKHRIVPPTKLGDHQLSYDRLVDLRYDRFDEEFIQVMTEDHDMAAELFRMQAAGGADPELKAFAAQNLPLIIGHLDHIRAMAGKKPAPAM